MRPIADINPFAFLVTAVTRWPAIESLQELLLTISPLRKTIQPPVSKNTTFNTIHTSHTMFSEVSKRLMLLKREQLDRCTKRRDH